MSPEPEISERGSPLIEQGLQPPNRINERLGARCQPLLDSVPIRPNVSIHAYMVLHVRRY
jgi:hypothetical protein